MTAVEKSVLLRPVRGTGCAYFDDWSFAFCFSLLSYLLAPARNRTRSKSHSPTLWGAPLLT